MELAGKKVIALGERDGVPGNAIADCVRSAGAEVTLTLLGGGSPVPPPSGSSSEPLFDA